MQKGLTKCISRYTISKETALRCTGSGELSGEPPVCIPVPCNDLPTINNSHIASSNMFTGFCLLLYLLPSLHKGHKGHKGAFFVFR